MSHRSSVFIVCQTADCGESYFFPFTGQHPAMSAAREFGAALQDGDGWTYTQEFGDRCPECSSKTAREMPPRTGPDEVMVWTDLSCDGPGCTRETITDKPCDRRDVLGARLCAAVHYDWSHRKPDLDFCSKCDRERDTTPAKIVEMIDRFSIAQAKSAQLKEERHV